MVNEFKLGTNFDIDLLESIINLNDELYKRHKKGCDLFIRFYEYRNNDFIPPII